MPEGRAERSARRARVADDELNLLCSSVFSLKRAAGKLNLLSRLLDVRSQCIGAVRDGLSAERIP